MTPTLTEVVDHFLHAVPIERVMKWLADVAAFDRYQASRGIGQAAECVASAALELGLEVTIEHFPADGGAHWWSFRAPMAWTPTAARLEIHSADGCVLALDHALQPFAVATYSAATPAGGVVARLVNLRGGDHQDLHGAVAIVDRSAMDRADALVACGAIGFLSDATSRVVAPGEEHRGRIELPCDSPIFAFSLTPAQMAVARAAAARAGCVHVTVDIDRRATMPVVSAVLPGDDSRGEVWLTAHLCHPRPGANDNASGVAALLGVAQAHIASRRSSASWRTNRTMRFLWGPEFVGLAAFLHQRRSLGAAGLPVAVINLDMVGEDQERCGSPFLIERSADLRPSLLNTVTEAVVHEVFSRTRAGGGTWRTVPFAGFSDHALFADPRLGCAAVQLCHVPDRFNHCAADTIDKVSTLEMRRSTGAAAAVAYLLGRDGALAHSQDVALLRSRCAAGLQTARKIAAEHGDGWGLELRRYARGRTSASLALLAGGTPRPGLRHGDVDVRDAQAVAGRWAGPFNTRAMLEDLPGRTRGALAEAIRGDKTILSLLFNFAIRANGRRTPRQIIRETSFELGRPLDGPLAQRLFAALLESGWMAEVPQGEA